jgi:iron complex outermembrane receptor protein
MNNLLRAFMLGSSTLAVTVGASFYATPASAQAQGGSEAAPPVEQVVVTGTSIRGEAPVGSNLMVVGSQDIQALSAQTPQDILANVPALMGMGNSGQAQSGGVAFQPIIHSLGAQASTSTLTLVDSHRIPASGTTHANTDPNMIPTNMIERVEVLADGASSVYGSDAVAGVVNFITRNKFDGVQLTGQTSFINGATDYVGGVLVGKSWADGSIVFGYTHTFEGRIAGVDRPFSATTNYTGFGGTNQGNFFCSPATLQPGGSGNIFLNATSGTSVANSAANSPCSQAQYNDLLPRTQRDNLMLKMSYDVTPQLTLSSDIVFATRTDSANISRGTLQATAFGTGAQANPFYTRPAGYTGTATNETVRWDADELLGPGAVSLNGAKDFYATGNAEYRLNDDWTFDFNGLAGTDTSYTDTYGTLNQSVATYALNGTDNTGGSLTYVVPGVGLVEPSQTLNSSNALDVWNPAATNRTNPALLANLTDNASVKEQTYSLESIRMSVNGTPLSLWAGPVKVALGVEGRNEQQDPRIINANNTGPASAASAFHAFNFHRQVASMFAEVDIPLVSPEMNVPLVQKFELNVSGRYDSYSDVGVTANPKAAFSWEATDWLKLRGNMSTSFVAPPMDTIGQSYPGYAYGSSASTTYGSTTNNVNVPVALFPQVTQFGIAGCTASSTTCNISSLTGLQATLDNPKMSPEKGRTWAVGADFTPDFIPGLTASMTLWNNSFRGAVTAPKIGFIVNNASLSQLLQFYPGGASQTQINSVINHQIAGGSLPAVTQYILLGENSNFLNLFVQGIDANVNYNVRTDWGTFTPGVALTEFLKFDQSYGAGSTYSVLNSTGANTAFPSVATQMRASLGWALDAYEADLFMNYTGAYKNWSATAFNPVTVNAIGNPSGGGDHVNANVTFDLHLAYDFNGGILGDDQISLTMRNIFNKNPPFYNSATGYDTYVGSVLGRVTTIGISAKL